MGQWGRKIVMEGIMFIPYIDTIGFEGIIQDSIITDICVVDISSFGIERDSSIIERAKEKEL